MVTSDIKNTVIPKALEVINVQLQFKIKYFSALVDK